MLFEGWKVTEQPPYLIPHGFGGSIFISCPLLLLLFRFRKRNRDWGLITASWIAILVLTLALWLREPRPWLRRLGLAALALVILQGVLGGLRVVLLEQTLAIVHAAIAQLFFALTVCLAVFTSTGWTHGAVETTLNDGGRLRRLGAVTTALVYGQIVFGAVLRHTGERVDAHLTFAALVTLHAMFIIMRVMKDHSTIPGLTRPALIP